VTTKATQTKIPPAAETTVLDELRRFTPEDVEAMSLSPFTARTLRNKAKARELYHHRDGARITFTLDDLRKNRDMGATAPLAASKKPRATRIAA